MHISISVALGKYELRRVDVAAEVLLPVLGQVFPVYLLYCDFFPFSLHVLTCPIGCRLQHVSAPRSVGFFRCPDLSLAMLSPGSECRSVGFFRCPDLSLAILSPVCECPSFGRILSVF